MKAAARALPALPLQPEPHPSRRGVTRRARRTTDIGPTRWRVHDVVLLGLQRTGLATVPAHGDLLRRRRGARPARDPGHGAPAVRPAARPQRARELLYGGS